MTARTSLSMAIAVAALLAVPPAALPRAIEERTVRVSAPAPPPNGQSSRPSISPAGRLVAFESTSTRFAPDANGQIRDIFLRDQDTGTVALVSVAHDGGATDGDSTSAVLAGATGGVAYMSESTNSVAGDTNGALDVFFRARGGRPQRVSVAHDGAQANGPSFEPDVSRDGRLVVFTSRADNLVPGDDNGVEDVFVRDLVAGTTRRVSQARGRSLPGRSRAPAISPDGEWVTYESTASTLVARDRNRVPDVFLTQLATGRTQRVSVSSREAEQNRAVTPPFVQVSDVSDGGRYVAFDSDATNLVPRDTNRDTDVFVRDVRRGRTERVSVTMLGGQGDNDSYIPSITRDGRYVGFSSFAGNLWTFDRPGEDVFVHDRALDTTVVMSVTTTGRRRPAEREPQLLRRPALSDSARFVAFSSTAQLAADDRDDDEDVVVRATAPPAGAVRLHGGARRPRLRLTADDPAARIFLCRVDRRRQRLCRPGERLRRLARGRHRVSVRAGGPGMFFDGTAARRRFRVR